MFLELVVDDWVEQRLPTSVEPGLCDQANHRCLPTFLVGSRVWCREELPQVPSAEGREKQGRSLGLGRVIWLLRPRGQRVGENCLVAPLLALD